MAAPVRAGPGMAEATRLTRAACHLAGSARQEHAKVALPGAAKDVGRFQCRYDAVPRMTPGCYGDQRRPIPLPVRWRPALQDGGAWAS